MLIKKRSRLLLRSTVMIDASQIVHNSRFENAEKEKLHSEAPLGQKKKPFRQNNLTTFVLLDWGI